MARPSSSGQSSETRQQPQRSVANHIRDRQRAVADREAARLARPDQPQRKSLGHADRTKSAVSSTPFGVLTKKRREKDVDDEWCGPFSVARRMIAQREEAKRQREQEQEGQAPHPLDEAMEALNAELKRKRHPSLQWKSRLPKMSQQESIYAKRQKRVEIVQRAHRVPSLFQLCVDFLVDNFEHVEALGDVDSSIRTAIIRELVAENKLTGQSFSAIAEVGVEALEVVDCSGLTQDVLSETLKLLLPAGLRYLVLDQAGRCFGHTTVEAIVTSSKALFAFSIGGAYLLRDADSATLVSSIASSASSLEFKACPLLGKEFLKSLSDSYASGNTLVELSLEDLSFRGTFDTLTAKPSFFQQLKSLSLRRIEGMDDSIVLQILKMSANVEQVDLSENVSLTDTTLSGIRQCPKVRSLTLAGLKNLTSEGLQALFTHIPGMTPPPMLRTFDLGNCNDEAVTDEVMELVTSAATTRRDGETTQIEVLGGLVHLNIQGASLLTDVSLEYIASSSASTLQTLNVSFCSRISDQGLGYLVEKCLNQLSRIEIWGCAQLTDIFLDGHRRVDDPGLEIAGAWMKKSTSRTIR